jgi:type II secretory pathway predicted ATPase ExeA/cell division septation protein DedD
VFESGDSQRPALFKLPPSAGSPASLTYEGHYGLREKPFSLSADPRFLFRSPCHGPAFDRLLAGIRRREGLIVLTGEVGTGKTTLCRAVVASLDRRTFSTFVPDPFVSREDLLKMLLVEFGVVSIDDLKSGRLKGASRADLSYLLYEFLNTLAPLQAYAVLVIDEAQNLSLPLLEEIRILSDLEGREKLLQIVLIGQPELRANLQLHELRQVNQRVSVKCELAPLRRGDLAGYVGRRLNVAGGGTATVDFTPGALDVVFRASRGTPRVINLICDRALHVGYERRAGVIDAEAIRDAVAVLDLSEPDEAREPEPPREPAQGGDSLAVDDSEAVAAFASERAPRFRARRRRLGVWPIVAMVSGILAAAIGASAVYLSQRDQVVVELPPLPASRPMAISPGLAVPVSPAATSSAADEPTARRIEYVIRVASFRNELRATQLLEELDTAGYRVYPVKFDLKEEGRIWQVVIGGYTALAEAESDLEKIRQMPAYGDANIARAASP